jgi:hypothetical protein
MPYVSRSGLKPAGNGRSFTYAAFLLSLTLKGYLKANLKIGMSSIINI